MNIEQWDEYIAVKQAMDALVKDLEISRPMKEMVQHACINGGKLIRPIILLLTTDLCGGDYKKSINAAVAIEMIHSASLIHDDVLDEGTLRRGAPSMYRQFGCSSAILCGDFLISKAIELISPYDSRAVRDFGRAGMHMSQGEVMDIISFKQGFGINEYIECVTNKTASLFSSSASIGAYNAGADEEMAMRCRRFGTNVGIAYQMVDDILEYMDVLDDKNSKKVSVSLPHIFDDQDMDRDDIISSSVNEVKKYVDAARSELGSFDCTETVRKLYSITDYITIDMLPSHVLD